MASEAKRKKCYTKSELLEKLKKNKFDVKRAVKELIEEVVPFDLSDESVSQLEDRVED